MEGVFLLTGEEGERVVEFDSAAALAELEEQRTRVLQLETPDETRSSRRSGARPWTESGTAPPLTRGTPHVL